VSVNINPLNIYELQNVEEKNHDIVKEVGDFLGNNVYGNAGTYDVPL